MFPKQPQPQPQPKPRDYTPELDLIQTRLADVTEILREQLRRSQSFPKVKTNLVTLGAPITLELQGYKYVGVIVSADTTMHVEMMNIKYDVTLTAGFNEVRLFDGASISTDSPVAAVIVYSFDQFK